MDIGLVQHVAPALLRYGAGTDPAPIADLLPERGRTAFPSAYGCSQGQLKHLARNRHEAAGFSLRELSSWPFALSKHLQQASAPALQFTDLTLQALQSIALRSRGLRAGLCTFDQSHAVREAADLRQAEAGAKQALQLPDLRHRAGREAPVAIGTAASRQQALGLVVT